MHLCTRARLRRSARPAQAGRSRCSARNLCSEGARRVLHDTSRWQGAQVGTLAASPHILSVSFPAHRSVTTYPPPLCWEAAGLQTGGVIRGNTRSLHVSPGDPREGWPRFNKPSASLKPRQLLPSDLPPGSAALLRRCAGLARPRRSAPRSVTMEIQDYSTHC